jgi:hypothetical protein
MKLHLLILASLKQDEKQQVFLLDVLSLGLTIKSDAISEFYYNTTNLEDTHGRMTH